MLIIIKLSKKMMLIFVNFNNNKKQMLIFVNFKKILMLIIVNFQQKNVLIIEETDKTEETVNNSLRWRYLGCCRLSCAGAQATRCGSSRGPHRGPWLSARDRRGVPSRGSTILYVKCDILVLPNI